MCLSLFRSKSKETTQLSPASNVTAAAHYHPATGNSSSNISNNNLYSSKSSSVSSWNSLSSLKDSLPENPHIYDISDIRAATDNFLRRPLSSSSSTTSWKSIVGAKNVVVTKRKLRRQLDTPELRKKLYHVCKFHHANLVKLHGATIIGNYIYLVYDHIHGANLNDCLRNPRNPNFTVLSNWLSRIQIAAGIADGIDYMHSSVGINRGYIHNHIKSTSIIISDESQPLLTAKICHFGTAQLCGEVLEPIHDDGDGDDAYDLVLKRVGSAAGKFEGTRGYMSPEFQSTGIPTLKCDVFAFGVVVLEILSGEEPLKVEVDQRCGAIRKVSLIESAGEAIAGGDEGNGKLRRWVDRRLKDSYPVEVAKSLTRVALECVQEDPDKRPDMGRVAGWISRLFLESKTWAQSFGVSDDITASFAPR